MILSTLSFIPLIFSVTAIFILTSYAKKIDFYDYPSSDRKHHSTPIPPVGGLAIFLGIIITFMLYEDLNQPHSFAFISALTLLVMVGAIDDYRSLSVKLRLASEIVAVLMMTELADIKINNIGDLLGSGNLHLGGYATVLTVFAVVGCINAFNMIDGIDGLSGSLALLSLTIIALLSAYLDNALLLKISLVVIGTVIAFLMFNLRLFRKRAVIFLGDSGSTLLGFIISWLIISGSQGERPILTPVLVLWVIALPLFDSICIMLRRVCNGKSPFAPDRGHLHHVLLRLGFSVNQTLIIMLMLALTMAVSSISASFFFAVTDHVLFEVFIGVFVLYYIFMSITNRTQKA